MFAFLFSSFFCIAKIPKNLQIFRECYHLEVPSTSNDLYEYFQLYNIPHSAIHLIKHNLAEIRFCDEWRFRFVIQTQTNKEIILKTLSTTLCTNIAQVIASFAIPSFLSFWLETLQETLQRSVHTQFFLGRYQPTSLATIISNLQWLQIDFYSFAELHLRIRSVTKNKAYFVEKSHPQTNKIQHVQLIYFSIKQSLVIYDYCLQTQHSHQLSMDKPYQCNCFKSLLV